MNDDEYYDSEEYDNSTNKVYANEYTSILNAFFENAIKPIFKNKPINRALLEDTICELDCKIRNPEFESLPFKLKDAYQRLRNFAEILDNSEDNEIKYQSEILEGLYDLASRCYYSEDEIVHIGKRNPCRNEQYRARAKITEVKKNFGETRLVLVASAMVDICRLCPHR